MNEKEEEIKYFVSNAPVDVPLDDLLLTAFSRWRVERSFEGTKQKLGLDHYEGRNDQGLIRHLLLCSLAYYFLQTQWLALLKNAPKNGELTFYQVVRAMASERTPPVIPLRILKINEYHQQRNTLATFCHRRTTRKRITQRGIDLRKIHRCQWT